MPASDSASFEAGHFPEVLLPRSMKLTSALSTKEDIAMSDMEQKNPIFS